MKLDTNSAAFNLQTRFNAELNKDPVFWDVNITMIINILSAINNFVTIILLQMPFIVIEILIIKIDDKFSDYLKNSRFYQKLFIAIL